MGNNRKLIPEGKKAISEKIIEPVIMFSLFIGYFGVEFNIRKMILLNKHIEMVRKRQNL